MSRIVDIYQLASYFPPCSIFRTRGTSEGMILKFKTYYLKIYDDNSEDVYIIQCYRYGCPVPMFVDKVALKNMREYASRFGE